MQHYVRELNAEVHCLQYICSKLPGHSSMDDIVKKHGIHSNASKWAILLSLMIHSIHER